MVPEWIVNHLQVGHRKFQETTGFENNSLSEECVILKCISIAKDVVDLQCPTEHGSATILQTTTLKWSFLASVYSSDHWFDQSCSSQSRPSLEGTMSRH